MYCTGESRFLQSPAWEKFLNSKGLETFRAGESLFVVHELPIVGNYAYSPRGPIIVESRKSKVESENESNIWEMIEEAKRRGCGWIRIEPNTEKELQKIRTSVVNCQLSIVKCLRSTQPKEILCMDITKSEEELLAEMKPKTRYNIRLAEKKGVTVIVSREKKYQEQFIGLVQETARRAGIRPYPSAHYEKIFEIFSEEMLALYVAEYQGKIIAANMMVFYGDTAIYLHGGSSNANREVMAPFLLQWRAIQDARKRGCVWYDLGGVATATADSRRSNTELRGKNTTSSPPAKGECRVREARRSVFSQFTIHNSQFNSWRGITRFKQGFCPNTESIKFPGTCDIVLAPMRYRMYRILRRLNRIG